MRFLTKISVLDLTLILSILSIAQGADSLNMKFVGACDTPGFSWSVTLSGSFAYIADDTCGLRVINISDPASPYEVGSYPTPGDCADAVAVSGSYAYLGHWDSGKMRVINISDPALPYEVADCATPGRVQGISIVGAYAYVADGFEGLRVIGYFRPYFTV